VPYSTSFFAGQVTETDAFVMLFTVPSSYVAVVRDVQVCNLTSDDTDLWISTNPGPASLQWAQLSPGASGGTAQWTGRVVLDAGWTLELYTEVEPLVVVASGYLLSSP
jgi:hypothetical protein